MINEMMPDTTLVSKMAPNEFFMLPLYQNV